MENVKAQLEELLNISWVAGDITCSRIIRHLIDKGRTYGATDSSLVDELLTTLTQMGFSVDRRQIWDTGAFQFRVENPSRQV